MFIVVVIFITVILLLFKVKKNNARNGSFKDISQLPGPNGLVTIAKLLLITPNTDEVFKERSARALKFYPIYKMTMLNKTSVTLISPEDIELVLTSMKHISKGRIYDYIQNWLGTGLLTSNGEKWHTRRKILTPAFHYSILQEFVNIFNRETKNLVNTLQAKCEEPYIDVVKPITEYTLYLIGETSLGVNFNNEPNCYVYKDAVNKFGHLLVYKLARPWLRFKPLYNVLSIAKEDEENIKILHDFSINAIKKRKEILNLEKVGSYATKKRLAMLDLLLKARYYDNANIDDDGIREEVDTFIFEGHDTTSVSLCYTLMALANEPIIQDEVYQEIIEILGDDNEYPDFNGLSELKFMERCIKESLRLYPSVPVITRVLGEDIKTPSGYFLPKGTNVSLLIFDMHRHPKVWNNPQKFDPDRFLLENSAKRHPFAYVPFSAGPRNCIGQKFANLEIKAALCGILRKFKLEKVHTPEDMRFKADMVLRPKDEIRVKFVLRKTKL